MIEQEFTQKELTKLYKKVFNSPDGKKILDILRKICYTDTTTMGTGLPIDTHLVTYREGMRSVVLHIEKNLKMIEKETEE